MRPRRPEFVDPQRFDVMSSDLDPAEVAEVAHRTAAVVVSRGRAADDPAVTARLVDLVRGVGLSTLAEVWSGRPARSLPGALWRLYLLHEWVQRQPTDLGRAFTAGAQHAEVDRIVAGVAEPPAPEDLKTLTDQILTGVYEGDFAVALERAAAFCHVVAVGMADPADADAEGSAQQAERAGRLEATAEDLRACAALWRRDELT